MPPRRSSRISKKPAATYSSTAPTKRTRTRTRHTHTRRPQTLSPPSPPSPPPPVFIGAGTLPLFSFSPSILYQIATNLDLPTIRSLRQTHSTLAPPLFPLLYPNPSNRPFNPLQTAAYTGDVAQIRTLVQQGYSPTVGFGNIWDVTSPLTIAAFRGHTSALKVLLDVGGASVTPLMWNPSFALGVIAKVPTLWSDELAVLLVRRGAVVSGRTWWKRTLLHWLAGYGNVFGVRLLCGRGADVRATGAMGETPLHSAVEGGRAEVVRALVRFGADVGMRDWVGKSLLHWAVEKGSVECVRVLVEVGVDVNVVDNNGRAVLHYVEEVERMLGMEGGKEAMRLLMEKADVGARDREGCTIAERAGKAEKMGLYRLITEKEQGNKKGAVSTA